MHRSSFDMMNAVRDAYLGAFRDRALSVLDVGSAEVAESAGTYRPLFAQPWRYVGLDTEAGRNVDLVVAEPYAWDEIADASFDVVISGQAFEHIAWPWLTMAEIARVLKVHGLAVITAPSAGHVHRFPLDCWRYFPDGLPALAAFAGLHVVEARTFRRYAYPECAAWGDSFAVLQRPARTGDEEREWAERRGALRRAAGLSPAPAEPAAASVSVLGRIESRDILRRHEAVRLAELSPRALKSGLLRDMARRLRFVLRAKPDELTR